LRDKNIDPTKNEDTRLKFSSLVQKTQKADENEHREEFKLQEKEVVNEDIVRKKGNKITFARMSQRKSKLLTDGSTPTHRTHHNPREDIHEAKNDSFSTSRSQTPTDRSLSRGSENGRKKGDQMTTKQVVKVLKPMKKTMKPSFSTKGEYLRVGSIYLLVHHFRDD
jgi:hypothetical protein